MASYLFFLRYVPQKNCEETFLHKNTIQYRLNQIHKKSGYNPREFQDAVRLYLALKM
ncbi:helix-turn-helix domain-containing protein [Blautia obeum]|uniref:helix-turn-helix domain-containing protein n=1 Tax=Blautia obeum TaxID=40520 RepID=UPI00156E0125|nr:PucR family transcriptional regulator [Blautia obeum]